MWPLVIQKITAVEMHDLGETMGIKETNGKKNFNENALFGLYLHNAIATNGACG